MQCIICGSDAWRVMYPARDRMFGLPGSFHEYECTGCGLVRLDPRPAKSELKKYYPSRTYYSYRRSTKLSFFGWLRSYLILHKLSLPFLKVPAIPKGVPGKILDIGCGSGDTLVLLRSVGWDVYGLDIDERAIDAARTRNLTHVRLGTYTSMSVYPDRFFDVIRLYHVIEHVDNPSACIALAYKKLKPGGELIVGTPNMRSLVASIFKQYWYNLDAPRHLYLFSPRLLSTLVKQNRFKSPRVEFSSAGGWIGSMQYVIREVFHNNLNLIDRVWLVMLFYPWEWVLDRFGIGDVFVLTAAK